MSVCMCTSAIVCVCFMCNIILTFYLRLMVCNTVGCSGSRSLLLVYPPMKSFSFCHRRVTCQSELVQRTKKKYKQKTKKTPKTLSKLTYRFFFFFLNPCNATFETHVKIQHRGKYVPTNPLRGKNKRTYL